MRIPTQKKLKQQHKGVYRLHWKSVNGKWDYIDYETQEELNEELELVLDEFWFSDSRKYDVIETLPGKTLLLQNL